MDCNKNKFLVSRLILKPGQSESQSHALRPEHQKSQFVYGIGPLYGNPMWTSINLDSPIFIPS